MHQVDSEPVPLFELPYEQSGLDAEADQEDVVVLDDVVFRFLVDQVLGLDFALASQADQVGGGGDFGADEAACHVGVHGAGGLEGGSPSSENPATDLFLVGGDEDHLASRPDAVYQLPAPDYEENMQ